MVEGQNFLKVRKFFISIFLFLISINVTFAENFNFETDPVCQGTFKPFIENELEQLKQYDEQRPDDITYIFHEHAARVANNMRKTCLHMKLGDIVANNMYWAILPHDIGKKNLPVELWDTEEKPTK